MVRRVSFHKDVEKDKDSDEAFDKDMGEYLQTKETKEKCDDENPLTKLTDVDCAWLAGLFQAEAYFAKDSRVHSKQKSPNYIPPPPKPYVKLDMVEKDLMLHVGNLLGEKVKELNRPTKAKKKSIELKYLLAKDWNFFLRISCLMFMGS
jgi:hypothetical protein